MRKNLRFLGLIFILFLLVNRGVTEIIKLPELQNIIQLKIIGKLVLSLLVLYVIKKQKIIIRNKKIAIFTIISTTILICSYFFTEGKLSQIYQSENGYKNLYFLLSCLFVAIFEELLFRVWLFESIYEAYKEKYSLFKIILLSSLLFGISHFVNFFNADYDRLSVINQMIFAFGVGLLLQSIYIRLRSVIPSILIHTIINYFGMYKVKLLPPEKNNGVEILNNNVWDDFKATFIFIVILTLGIILPFCYFLLRKYR